MAGPYLSWSCSTADCQLHLSVLYGTMQVHYVSECSCRRRDRQLINVMENIVMPATNANPRWEWDERFRFTHHGECLTCRLYRWHIIASELEEDLGLEAARAFPSEVLGGHMTMDGWLMNTPSQRQEWCSWVLRESGSRLPTNPSINSNP